MRRRLQILLLCLLSLSGWSQTVVTLRETDWGNPLTLVVLSEGYTADQDLQFYADASTAADGLLSEKSLVGLEDRWAARAVFVASAESGADEPTKGVFRDTHLDASFDNGYAGGTDRLLVLTGWGYWRAYQDAAFAAPSNVLVVVLVNSARYGGSGGSVAVMSRHLSSREIAAHEALGHALAACGDEYTTPYPGYPNAEEPNTTTNIFDLKWRDIVATFFEGAHYHAKGWYRPEADCKMRTLGKPFCKVCAATIRSHVLARTAISKRPLGSVPFMLQLQTI